MAGVVYKPVVETRGTIPAATAQGEPRDERSEYQRARDHFRGFFAGKPVEELRAQRQRLAAARAAIGRRPGEKSWLSHQSAVYFWALAQEVEIDEAIRRAKGG
jgi:hypothetical protein